MLSLILSSLLAQAPASPAEKADFVLRGGRVATMNPAQPWAQAIAARQGKIVFVGRDAEVEPWIGEMTEVHDAEGMLVIPGLIESHGHLLGLGFQKVDLELSEFRNEDEIADRVRVVAQAAKEGEWILGRGWDQNRWGKKKHLLDTKDFPTHRKISQAAPKNPVVLTRVDGHALWANEAAMRVAGISKETKDPEGGRIHRDLEGNPTGIFIDAAMALLRKHIPPRTREQKEKALLFAGMQLQELGVTGFHDAGVGAEDIEIYRKRFHSGFGHLRVYAMLHGNESRLLDDWFRQGPLRDDRITVRAVKVYADGALGSRGAALLEDYADEPGNRGLLQVSEPDFLALTKRALAAGFQVCTHAIGDRGNRLVLDAYEKTLAGATPAKDLRWRIEHAQILDEKDIPRFAKLGVIASMQPTHCSSDMPWVPARIGEARTAEGAYVWRKLRESGAHLVFGSDAPVESVNPFYGIYAAVTRRDPATKEPTKGFHPEQCMTVEEALRAYTLDAAYAAFAEHRQGSIEIGKFADFVVLKQDIFVTEPDRWKLQKMVRLTVFDGRMAYFGP